MAVIQAAVSGMGGPLSGGEWLVGVAVCGVVAGVCCCVGAIGGGGLAQQGGEHGGVHDDRPPGGAREAWASDKAHCEGAPTVRPLSWEGGEDFAHGPGGVAVGL